MPAPAVDSLRTRPSEFDELNDFNYRPLPVTAVVGFVLALISTGGIFVWMVLPLCLLAGLISAVSLLSILRSRGAYSGSWLAGAGVIVAAVSFAAGLAVQVHAYQTEVPPGAERISFSRDISEKQFVIEQEYLAPHPDVRALEGKEVFLKGFMYPTQQSKGLRTFLMLKDNNECCFGGKPALTDRLGVIMNEGLSVDYFTGRVAIAGTFKINPEFNPHDDLDPLYIVEAKYFSRAKSDF